MFGLVDRWYAHRKSRIGYVEAKQIWEPETLYFGGKEIDWYCFVPRTVSRKGFIRRGLIPKDGNVFVYTISSSELIGPDPQSALRGLQRIYDDAARRLQSTVMNRRAIGILGVSLGNVFAVRLAHQAGRKIFRIVAIVGGGRLGPSARESLLTGDITKRSGCTCAEIYDQTLSVFNPVNYINAIEADKVVIRLGTQDLLIPFAHGRELAQAFLHSKGVAVLDSKAYKGADHGSAIVLSALENILHDDFFS